MAVVKATFTRSKGAAAANVRYISHRAGKDGEKISRQLFGHDGPLTKEEIYAAIKQAGKGTLFYRFSLNPDPRKEDWDRRLDLAELTTKMIRALEKRLG